MTIRASRGARLLVAAGLAWLGLALCAQAAHATYGKVQVAKINQGGDPDDTFSFHPSLTPSAGDFSIKGGQSSSVFNVECNINRPNHGTECTSRWGNVTLKMTEQPKPGYTLTNITCRFTQGTDSYGAQPTTSSPVKPSNEAVVDLSAGTVTLKVHWYEWVKCWYTNTRDTGTVTVIKHVVPPLGGVDNGRFNLLLDGNVLATDVGDGGSTGPQTVTTGTHTVGETAGTGTNLADYSSSTACIDTAHDNASDLDGTLDVGRGDAWVCTITNTNITTPPVTPQPPAVTPPPVTQPQIVVSPVKVRPGSARLSGPTRCQRTAAAATVTGRRIVKVTFYVDGRKVKTLTNANRSGGRWSLEVAMHKLSYGTHQVRVRVEFAKSSATRAKILHMTVSRCQPATVAPQFTG